MKSRSFKANLVDQLGNQWYNRHIVDGPFIQQGDENAKD